MGRNGITYRLLSWVAFCLVCVRPMEAVAYHVSCNDARLQYMGRINNTDTSQRVLYWPGSTVTINFTGTEIQAILKDEKGPNYWYVVVDGAVKAKLKTTNNKETYTLAQNLNNGQHTVMLYRLTENRTGPTTFYGFELPENSKVMSPAKQTTRRIEYYGNSITSGYSVDDTAGDSGAPEFFNNYYSYASVTARHYKAAYHCISKSGIGLMVSWFPLTMPEMYNRLDPDSSGSQWDFSSFHPQVVVVNLLQNDSWLVNMPDNAQFKARFGTTKPSDAQIVTAYANFIRTLRAKRPSATIICVLGCMDITKEGSKWPGLVKEAATSLHDTRVLTHFFPYKNAAGHPKRKEQAKMAASLIQFIDQHVKW